VRVNLVAVYLYTFAGLFGLRLLQPLPMHDGSVKPAGSTVIVAKDCIKRITALE